MRPELIGGRIIFCTWGLKLIQVISRFGVYLLIFVLMCRDRPGSANIATQSWARNRIVPWHEIAQRWAVG